MTLESAGAASAGVDGGLAQVLLYSLPGCGSCFAARHLLRRRGIEFEEIGGSRRPDFRGELIARTGGATVPQVVIDGEAIGGGDSLFALDRLGVLVPRVRRQRFPLVLIRRSGVLRRRYEVAVLEADGKAIAKHAAASAEEAERIAATLRAEFSGGGGCGPRPSPDRT